MPTSHAGRARVLLHIGYHKTGTTWLQQVLFHAPGRGFSTRDRHALHAVEILVHCDPLSFDVERAREEFAEDLERAKESGTTFVISHERLSGYPAGGGYDSKEIAERLAATFPGARVLIGIREQVAALESMYPQYVEDGGTLSLRRFLDPPNPYGGLPAFRMEFYEYDRSIRHYQRLFGTDSVLVLPIELLRRDPQAYLDRVTAFCGAPRVTELPARVLNPRRSPVYVFAKRMLNRLFSRSALSDQALFDVPLLRTSFVVLAPLFGVVFKPIDGLLRKRWRRRIADHVGQHYRASNARTSALIGIELGALGYLCGPQDPAEEPIHVGKRYAAPPATQARLLEFFLRHPRLKNALEWWLAGDRAQR